MVVSASSVSFMVKFGGDFMLSLSHVGWPLQGFANLDRIGYSGRTRYPVKFLRYWFCRCVLEDLYTRMGRPIRVLEVGVADGKMLAFLAGDPKPGGYSLPQWIERWDGLDVVISADALDRYSYSECIEADVEAPFPYSRKYDAVVLLHVLEHLFEPEATMSRLVGLLNSGGVCVGGSPTMPSSIAALWEPLLRRKHSHLDVKSHRHLSAITPRRIRRFARGHSLGIDLLAGTFFCRWSGMFLENTQAWLRANLLWGALFPAFGGELYFSMRKPN
jgi:SAM-dependent methyltransferase